MIARRKPKKKGAVESRIKALSDEAAAKGEKQYQADLAAAKESEAKASKPQKERQGAIKSFAEGQSVYGENFRRAAVNATPSKDVETRKQSGMYQGSVPVAGTSDKKLYAKRNPKKGVRNSDAKASVKRSMIRQMRSSGY